MRLPFFFKSISSWGDYPPTHPPTHPSNQPTKYSPNPPTHPPTTGNKACISYGLALVGLAFLFIGPFPFPFPPPPLTLVWSLLLLSLSLIGLGSALIVVPAVPLMLDRKETTHPLLDLKDPISSLYTLAWSVGDAAGPFLGGVLTQLLPQTDEVVCLGRKEEGEGGGGGGGGGGGEGVGCLTSFRWSATVFGLVVWGVWVLMWVVVPPDVVEEDEEKEGVDGSPLRRGLGREGGGGGGGGGGEEERLLAHTHHRLHRTEGGLEGVGAYHAISHRHATLPAGGEREKELEEVARRS